MTKQEFIDQVLVNGATQGKSTPMGLYNLAEELWTLREEKIRAESPPSSSPESEKAKFEVVIQRRKVVKDKDNNELDTMFSIFEVELSQLNAGWSDSFGSREDLELYLRGVRAAASMCGVYVTVPPIP
jgi:hypothetical protein